MNRFAGKVLNDFLKVAGSAIGSAVEQKVLGKVAGMSVDAPGLRGMVARNPEAVAKLAGAAAPVAATALASAPFVLPGLLQGGDAQSSGRSTRMPAFSTSPYIPGTMPFTNAQMGSMMLNQQNYQNQLALLQARQSVSQYKGSLRQSGNIDSILDLAGQIYG